jgi:peptidoglycan/xylan/chitin deacetylase (PgdA/CDA1 family)
MNRTVASLVKRSLLRTGYYPRRLRGDRFPGVAVLCYHGVRAGDQPRGAVPFDQLHVHAGELEAHCRLIRETCHPIGLAQWRAALAGGPPLPPRAVLFTFDDGYRAVYTHARPILERYAIPAVVFVCSDPVAERRLFWHDALARAHGESEVERAKRLPFGEWQALSAASSRPVEVGDASAPLTVSEIKALAGTLVEIGAHTADHAILARADREEQRGQIARNKAQLEAWIGRPVRAFAYPNGRPGHDYTALSVALVEALGFDFAFTTRPAFASAGEPPLERSRFLMLAGISPAELAHRLSYSWRR